MTWLAIESSWCRSSRVEKVTARHRYSLHGILRQTDRVDCVANITGHSFDRSSREPALKVKSSRCSETIVQSCPLGASQIQFGMWYEVWVVLRSIQIKLFTINILPRLRGGERVLLTG